MPAENCPSEEQIGIETPLHIQPSSEQKDCQSQRPCANLHGPVAFCKRCRPDIKLPVGLPGGGRGCRVKRDDPTVRLASKKAVEEFNRRNKDRYLTLSKILEARYRFISSDIFHLTIEATEEENVERGPCTRLETALKEKNAKDGLKRCLPQTVDIEAYVVVSPNGKRMKVDLVLELQTELHSLEYLSSLWMNHNPYQLKSSGEQ